MEELLEGPPRRPESPLTQREMDIAASVQEVTEEIQLRSARFLARRTGLRRLVLAGGVALNCVANARILRDGCFDEVWIQPAAGDAIQLSRPLSQSAVDPAGSRLFFSEQNTKALVTLDLEHRTFRVDRDPRVHALPRDVEMKLFTAQSDLVSETVGAIRFFPDGGSNGGRVTIAAGERKFDVDIDWLTGRVAILD
jgi:hypothetical protein